MTAQGKMGLGWVRVVRMALVCLAWAHLGAAPPLGAQIHMWTDANGVRHFSDWHPPDVDPKAVKQIASVPTEGTVREADLKPEAVEVQPSTAGEEAAEAERLKAQREEEERRRLEAEQAEAQRLEAEKKQAERQEKSAAKKARIRAAGQ